MQINLSDTTSGPASGQSSNGKEHPSPYPPPAEAFSRLGSLFGELKEYLSYYLSAKADSYKASIRQIGLYAVLGLVGLMAGGAIVATACVLLLLGIAGGLGALCGHHPWIGAIIVGGVVLLCVALGAWLMLSRLTKSFRSSTVKKYEQRKDWQRGQFGRTVEDAARQAH